MFVKAWEIIGFCNWSLLKYLKQKLLESLRGKEICICGVVVVRICDEWSRLLTKVERGLVSVLESCVKETDRFDQYDADSDG